MLDWTGPREGGLTWDFQTLSTFGGDIFSSLLRKKAIREMGYRFLHLRFRGGDDKKVASTTSFSTIFGRQPSAAETRRETRTCTD